MNVRSNFIHKAQIVKLTESINGGSMKVCTTRIYKHCVESPHSSRAALVTSIYVHHTEST